MNFFEHQDAARRNTRRLVLLYALAVVGVVLAVDLVIALAYLWGAWDSVAPGGRSPGIGAMLKAVPRGLYLWGTAVTSLVILAVSAFNILKLRGGGEEVAEMAGARPVDPATDDPLERRLLNVVEEMAIASGVRVPRVYVMDDEAGINAFAAGYDVSSAVVAVTRGTLETLNRDELQGVIAHEFSHILNGDMRLNIRMIGVLAGIVFIGAVGGFIMRSVGESRGRKDGAALGIFLFGLALFIIGYVGLFFARLIKAAVSRQREFLADSSSVQFTRNPDGIAGALDQILASEDGSLVANRYAEDMSHMYFGGAVHFWLTGLFATHPPVEERIERVRPGFHRTRYRAGRAEALPQAAGEAAQEATAPAAVAFTGNANPGARAPAGARAGDASHAWGRTAAESAALVGSLDAGKVTHAQRLLASLPEGLRKRLASPAGASVVLIGLVLADNEAALQGQLTAARAAGSPALAEAARSLAPMLRRLGAAYRLVLVDLALPAVRSAPEEMKRGLLAAMQAVIHADRRVSLHELVVLTLVRSQLEPLAQSKAARAATVGAVREEAVLVLTMLAQIGRRPGAEGERDFEAAFRAGAIEMGLGDAQRAARETLTMSALGAAIERLRALAPMAQAKLVKGLFAAATADRSIRVAEAEFMRLIGASLGCPLPPMIEELDPGQLAGAA